MRNYRKDGTRFWNELTISPVYDNQGDLTHFVGIQNDITNRKQADERNCTKAKAVCDTWPNRFYEYFWLQEAETGQTIYCIDQRTASSSVSDPADRADVRAIHGKRSSSVKTSACSCRAAATATNTTPTSPDYLETREPFESSALAASWLQSPQGSVRLDSPWIVAIAVTDRMRPCLPFHRRGAVDISNRKELQKQVLEIAAAEDRRIGHELHDHTQQQLTGLGLLAQSVADLLKAAKEKEPRLS